MSEPRVLASPFQRRGGRLARAAVTLAVAVGLLAATGRGLGLGLTAAARAFAALTLVIVPIGYLITRRLRADLVYSGERLVLVCLVGYPTSCALFFVLSVMKLEGLFVPLVLVAAGVSVGLCLRDRSSPVRAARMHGSLLIVAPLILYTLTRGNGAFAPSEGGLAYNHSVDHSVHLSFYWELLRGMPPRQLPTAAGVPFPTYHVLSFMPGIMLIKHAGLPVTTVYHAVSPLLRLALLMGAIYLAVRARTGDGRLAAAALPALLLVTYAFEDHFRDRVITGPTPHYFFLRSESGGGAIVVWATAICLLMLYQQARSNETKRLETWLYLASALAGLSLAFKAQMFVLFGGAYCLALGLLLLRDRSRPLATALLLTLATSGLSLWLSRGQGPVGTLHFTPGLLAQEYVYPNLRHDPLPFVSRTLVGLLDAMPGGLGWVVATPLALWRLVQFSPLVPAFVLDRLRSYRNVGLGDATLALSFLVALPLAYGFSATAIDGRVSPFEFLQAAQGLAFLGAVVSVVVLAALLDRMRMDGGGWVLITTLVASAGVWPWLALSKPYTPPREEIVLGPDEQCALLFLRRHTPLDAVVVSARTESFEDLRRSSKALNHHAVVGGFAGRRAVLEYYGKDVDPERDRPRAIRRLFSVGDAGEALRLLRRYKVDYIVEYAGLPLKFPKTPLRMAFERGGVRIYQVRGEGEEHAAAVPDWSTGRRGEAADLQCE